MFGWSFVRTLSIWMNDTLRYMYVKFPQIRLSENMTPIGTIVRKYTRPVMGTFLRESRMVVKRASSWVIRVAKPKCQVVRAMG